ncbi:MAG: hypothetical protein M1832_004425 [Thelocarpon impressellum]|nr:MAG: hypothetical protein M1832_004425 [Thelocarpon impressellum]
MIIGHQADPAVAASLAARAASSSARVSATLSSQARNDTLTAIHRALAESRDSILSANSRDLAAATKAAEDGQLSQSLLKRLDLTRTGKWEEMLQGILDVRDLEDPGNVVGRVTLRTKLDEGLELERVSCPIGVLLVIFEARPEVIANITALAIKSGNAAILKGGKESTETFVAISDVISQALRNTEVPNDSIQLLTTRDIIPDLLAQDRFVDLVIPRGSNELVRTIKEGTRIPVLGHADGLCSIYLHASADAAVAEKVLLDAKTGYPAACNSVETLLVDEAALTSVLPRAASALLAKGVSLRCDGPSKAALSTSLPASESVLLQDATEADYNTEFLDLILAIKTIPPPSSRTSPLEAVDFAVAHINAHSSHHTDAIIAADEAASARFLAGVDSAGVFSNASTRLADGMRFGFGTEVGISTNKIHARGPVGLDGLTIYKYLIRGRGQVAAEYHAGEGGRRWLHEQMLPRG